MRTGHHRRSLPIVLIAAALALSAGFAQSQTTGKAGGGTGARLKEVQRQLESGRTKSLTLKRKSTELEAEVVKLRRDLIEAASIIQSHERRAGELADRLRTLESLQSSKSVDLMVRRRQFGATLMALQKVARHPPEALVAQPISPAETVRSAILLRAAVPEIERRAVRLSEELDFLDRTRTETRRRKADLEASAKALAVERKRLGLLLARKSVLMRRTVTDRRSEERRVGELVREAQGLRGLLRRLEGERKRYDQEIAAAKRRRAQHEAAQAARTARHAVQKKTVPEMKTASVEAPPPATKAAPKPPPGFTHKPFSKARGHLPYPAVGRVIGHYGQRMSKGLTRKGIDLATQHAAQVVAPYEGRVVFAGPFRGYGLLLIIEHSEGYHSLMAGMARIDGTIGQWVLAGEPVGVMADAKGGAETSGKAEKPILYVEFRRDGEPINPVPWLASNKEKASG